MSSVSIGDTNLTTLKLVTSSSGQSETNKLKLNSISNQITIGDSYIFNFPTALSTYTIGLPYNIDGNSDFIISRVNQTITGIKSFSGGLKTASIQSITDSVDTLNIGNVNTTGNTGRYQRVNIYSNGLVVLSGSSISLSANTVSVSNLSATSPSVQDLTFVDNEFIANSGKHYNIPTIPTSSTNLVVTQGDQIISGVLTFNLGVRLGQLDATGDLSNVNIGSDTGSYRIGTLTLRGTTSTDIYNANFPNNQFKANSGKTYTIPTTTTSAELVLTEENQTINGQKTISDLNLSSSSFKANVGKIYNIPFVTEASTYLVATNGSQTIDGTKTFSDIVFSSNSFTSNSGKIYNIPSVTTSASLVVTEENQTINGTKTFSDIVFSSNSFKANSGKTYNIPSVTSSANLVLTEASQTINGFKTFSSFVICNAGVSSYGNSHYMLSNGGAYRSSFGLSGLESETVTNSGSNLAVFRYSDSGSFLGYGWYMYRNTGKLCVGSAASYASIELTTSTKDPNPTAYGAFGNGASSSSTANFYSLGDTEIICDANNTTSGKSIKFLTNAFHSDDATASRLMTIDDTSTVTIHYTDTGSGLVLENSTVTGYTPTPFNVFQEGSLTATFSALASATSTVRYKRDGEFVEVCFTNITGKLNSSVGTLNSNAFLPAMLLPTTEKRFIIHGYEEGVYYNSLLIITTTGIFKIYKNSTNLASTMTLNYTVYFYSTTVSWSVNT